MTAITEPTMRPSTVAVAAGDGPFVATEPISPPTAEPEAAGGDPSSPTEPNALATAGRTPAGRSPLVPAEPKACAPATVSPVGGASSVTTEPRALAPAEGVSAGGDTLSPEARMASDRQVVRGSGEPSAADAHPRFDDLHHSGSAASSTATEPDLLSTTEVRAAGGGFPVDPEPEPAALPSAGNGDDLPPDPKAVAAASDDPERAEFLMLRILADSYDDTQRLRIATTNRALRAPVLPDALVGHIDALEKTEHQLALAMRREFRRCAPEVAAWVKDTSGLGEHLMARLLGAIGDPVHAEPWTWMTEKPDGHECSERCGDERHLVALEPFERTPRQLAQFCGYGDPADRRRKGMSQDDAMRLGNPRAKMLLHLLAEACMKCAGSSATTEPPDDSAAQDHPAGGGDPLPDEATSPSDARLPTPVGDPSPTEPLAVPTADGASAGGRPSSGDADELAPAKSVARRRSPYRDAYDLARSKYAGREDWTAGHQHNAALRYVAKQIIVDLWRVSNGLDPRWSPC